MNSQCIFRMTITLAATLSFFIYVSNIRDVTNFLSTAKFWRFYFGLVFNALVLSLGQILCLM